MKQNLNQKLHKAKKSLGQNFLKSEQALREIIKAGEIKREDVILEIGPGKGALTARLLEHSDHVVAVEKDRDLMTHLALKFAKEISEKKLTLIEGDILELQVNFLQQNTDKKFLNTTPSPFGHSPLSGGEKSYKVIANIPYNITGAILKKFLTDTHQPELMVLMVQHEVAKRIVARDNKESILSVSVKAYGEPKMIMKVPARYFSPAPKVDSAVIAIKNISRSKFQRNTTPPGLPLSGEENSINEERFWEIVKAGFAHKRKILVSNLKLLDSKKNWIEIFTKLNIKNTARAEDLSLNHWISLTKE